MVGACQADATVPFGGSHTVLMTESKDPGHPRRASSAACRRASRKVKHGHLVLHESSYESSETPSPAPFDALTSSAQTCTHMTVMIPTPPRLLPLVMPEPPEEAARKLMWEEARRIYERILAETGAPPKWELLMRDRRFREIVEAENERIQRKASAELTARWAKEAALQREIEEQLKREQLERRRVERVRREIRLWALTPKGELAESMGTKQELDALEAPKNPNTDEGWMYHVTAFGNLLGIYNQGLIPVLGGTNLGACNLVELLPSDKQPKLPKNVKNVQQLAEDSRTHSKDRIAASTNRLLSGTYINQREDVASQIPGQPLGYFSVMLRFRNRYTNSGHSKHNRWIKDPMDARARLLIDTRIPVLDIEVLTSEGWIPLRRLNIGIVRQLISDTGGYDPDSLKK